MKEVKHKADMRRILKAIECAWPIESSSCPRELEFLAPGMYIISGFYKQSCSCLCFVVFVKNFIDVDVYSLWLYGYDLTFFKGKRM